MLELKRNGNIFRVVKGDFGLKGDIDVNGNIHNKKFPNCLKEPNNYPILAYFYLHLFYTYQSIH
jgi:hypothetical protein